jgi:predicted SnoaL-like aldol condensation-catalyzing enzyme
MKVKLIAVTLSCLTMGTTVAQAQTINQQKQIKTMIPKEVVQLFQEALGKGDAPTAFSFFATDVKWHQPGANQFSGTKNGIEELGKMFGGMMEASKGTLVVKPNGALMVNGNLVAAPVRFSGNNGINSIDMIGVDLFEVKEGKIVQVWLFSDAQQNEDDFWGK